MLLAPGLSPFHIIAFAEESFPQQPRSGAALPSLGRVFGREVRHQGRMRAANSSAALSASEDTRRGLFYQHTGPSVLPYAHSQRIPAVSRSGDGRSNCVYAGHFASLAIGRVTSQPEVKPNQQDRHQDGARSPRQNLHVVRPFSPVWRLATPDLASCLVPKTSQLPSREVPISRR